MSIKRWLIMAVVAILGVSVLALPACAEEEITPAPVTPAPVTPAPVTPPPHEQFLLEMITSSTTNIGMAVNTALVDMLNKYHPWIRSSATMVGGMEDTIIQAEGKVPTTLFGPSSFDYWAALRGIKPWPKEYTDMRLITCFMRKTMNAMSNSPELRTLEDFAGKKMVALRGSMTTEMLKLIIEEAGLTDQIEIELMQYGDQFVSMKDRLSNNVLDSIVFDLTTGTGHIGSYMEEALFALRGEVYPVELPPELIVAANTKLGMGYRAVENPPGVLETQDRPWHGMSPGGFHTIVTWKDADEEVIYEITKLLMEHAGELKDYHVHGAFISAESMMTNLPIQSEDEIHPGALRYYKESGLWDLWTGPVVK